jgi:GAF domain-containing protein
MTAGTQVLIRAVPPRAGVQLAEEHLGSVLDRIAELSVRSIRGASEASVTLVTGGPAHTAAFTGALALHLDEWQYRHGHGPCLEATDEQTLVVAPDLTTEIRWYNWTAQAVAAGVRGALSIGLAAGGRIIGSLNIYARTAGALDADSPAPRLFAANAATALATILFPNQR